MSPALALAVLGPQCHLEGTVLGAFQQLSTDLIPFLTSMGTRHTIAIQTYMHTKTSHKIKQINLLYSFLILFCVLVLPECIHVCGCQVTGVTDSCEVPCGFWKLKPAPLEEQPVLLTV